MPRILRFPTFLLLFFAGIFCFSGVHSVAQNISVGEKSAESRYLSEKYFSARPVFNRGDYIEALQIYGDEVRQAEQNGRKNWVDSICYFAMIGECHYQMGENGAALACFNLALQAFSQNISWLNWLHFETSASVRKKNKTATPWGGGESETILIAPLGVNIEYVVSPSGADGISNRLQAETSGVMKPISPSETAQCIVLAMRRRAELLGPMGEYDLLNDQLTTQLKERPYPSNHWTRTWGDIFFAMTLITAGNDAEAKKILEKCRFTEQSEHPLTGAAALELGKIAMRAKDYPAAYRHFQEASISAWQYADTLVLESVFRHLAAVQRFIDPKTPSPILPKAAYWAEKEKLRGLQIVLHTLMAEDNIFLQNVTASETQLKRARTLAEQRDIENGRLMGTWNYIGAVIAYQSGNLDAGDNFLNVMIHEIRRTSIWIFQLKQLEELYKSGRIAVGGTVSPRVASELYETLLREPDAFDWSTQPADSLIVTIAQRSGTFEQWFTLEASQHNFTKAFEIAEFARRSRFQSTLRLGGRLISLRFLLEAPERLLKPEHLRLRKTLSDELPGLAKLSEDVRRLRNEMATLPLMSEDAKQKKQIDAQYRELKTLAAAEESMLSRFALGRKDLPNIFPPVTTFEDFRKRLSEKTKYLVYFEALGDYYGFLIGQNGVDGWRIADADQLKKDAADYLTLAAQASPVQSIPIAALTDNQWAKSGKQLLQTLLGGERTLDFQELAIVPDGFLWYVPFETLSVETDGKIRPLIALNGRTLRYAPTASLGLPTPKSSEINKEGNNAKKKSVVFLGKQTNKQETQTAADALERWRQDVPELQTLTPQQITQSPALTAKFIDELIVLGDLFPSGSASDGYYDWSFFYGRNVGDKEKKENAAGDARLVRGAAFGEWLRLPWGGPRMALLPGYRTAAENAMQNNERLGDGSETFIPLTALLSCGAETVILGRWQSGGRSAYDFTGNFLKNREQYSPPQAWRRAVLQTAASKLSAAEEPRIEGTAAEKASLDARANHPFFWGAFLFCHRGE
ncbi:MAG: CHAT domain-containing protein [Planctomycetaceae bacterium]|nr:CHAT domain-containing protein [Planctomycetaceae bacterium]